MLNRWNIIFLLVVVAGVSTWVVNLLGTGNPEQGRAANHQADYYMQQFSTSVMDTNGALKQKLSADYLEHYADDDTTELTQPRLELHHENRQPLHVKSEQGWLTSDNQVILLTGEVSFWQNNPDGIRVFDLYTRNVRLLTDQEYAETDQPVVFTSARARITAVGMRVHFKESRIELLNNVYTKILPGHSAVAVGNP